jgi:hypothetical protein
MIKPVSAARHRTRLTPNALIQVDHHRKLPFAHERPRNPLGPRSRFTGWLFKTIVNYSTVMLRIETDAVCAENAYACIACATGPSHD